jgi:acyl-CoA-binding protein
VNVVEVPREDPKQENMFGSIFERIMKLEKLITAGSNIVETVEEVISGGDDEKNNDDILLRLEKLENKHAHSDSDGESDGFDIMGKVQQDLYESNQRISKLENKLKKMTTLVNKLAKQN